MADTLQRLDEHGAPRAAADVIAGLRLDEDLPADGRPRVVAVMISSADGRAAVRGRSGGLGHPGDRALLRTLREHVDAVLVGTGTLRAEGYANMLDRDQRERRAAAGRTPLPDVATITRRLEVPTGIGLFAEPDATVRVYTERGGDVPTRGARVVVHRCDPLTLCGVLQHLRAEAGVRSVACEGGPTLLRALAQERCLDDLLLTVAPLLVAGTEVAPLEGPELDPPAALRLADVHRADSHLFLHYAVDATA